MPAVAQPMLIVNGVNLNSWIGNQILWKQCEGLMDGTALEPGATLDTFDGKAKVRSHDMAYQARRIVITGRIINRSGWLDKQKAIADLAQAFAGKPAIVRLGTLYLECEFGQVKPVQDEYSHLPDYQTWRVEGEAVPGTFFGQYHTAIGAEVGLVVQDDRPDSAAVKFASNSFTYTNPGTAPTEACVSLTGTASTTYYLKGKGLRRVPMTTDASGNASIDEASSFVVYPGANAIRVEDSAGNLATGVTAVNLYGTRPRFLGNTATTASTQSSTTNRMSEGPMLTVTRTGSAYYINAAGTFSVATGGHGRIGVPFGSYISSNAGLILEGPDTNLLSANQSSCETDTSDFTIVGTGTTLTRDTTTAFEGSASLKIIANGAVDPQGFAAYATLQSSTTYMVSLRLRASAPCNMRFFLHRYSPSSVYGLVTIPLTTSWDIYTIFVTTPASSSGSWGLRVDTPSPQAVTFWADCLEIKPTPFQTSWVKGGSPRNGDQIGVSDLDPTFQQNGAVEFVAVLAQPITTGRAYTIIGAAQSSSYPYVSSPFGLTRLSWQVVTDKWVYFGRSHNGATGADAAAGSAYISVAANLWDGNPHRIRLEWYNYLLNGTRYMLMKAYVDGALIASQDVAALYGATAWAAIDPGKLISDGSSFSILRLPSDGSPLISYPTLPQGAIPAA